MFKRKREEEEDAANTDHCTTPPKEEEENNSNSIGYLIDDLLANDVEHNEQLEREMQWLQWILEQIKKTNETTLMRLEDKPFV